MLTYYFHIQWRVNSKYCCAIELCIAIQSITATAAAAAAAAIEAHRVHDTRDHHAQILRADGEQLAYCCDSSSDLDGVASGLSFAAKC